MVLLLVGAGGCRDVPMWQISMAWLGLGQEMMWSLGVVAHYVSTQINLWQWQSNFCFQCCIAEEHELPVLHLVDDPTGCCPVFLLDRSLRCILFFFFYFFPSPPWLQTLLWGRWRGKSSWINIISLVGFAAILSNYACCFPDHIVSICMKGLSLTSSSKLNNSP